MRKASWRSNEVRIRRAIEKGAKTLHEIFLETRLTYRTIRKHLKEAPDLASSS